MNSFRSLDLNLLRVLDVLLAERSVTRAAAVLHRTQPTISNALRRLRAVLGDELLVRGSKGLVLTPRAEQMRGPLREAISQLEQCLDGQPQFDPARARGSFRISAPDRLSLSIVPSLFDRLRQHAPHMTLEVATADSRHAMQLLEEDQTDVALAWYDGKPRHLSSEVLYEEQLFCVFRPGHPLARTKKRFDLAAVLSFPHLVVSATGTRSAIFDELLARRGLQRRPLVSVSNFTAVPHLLARSDMVGVFTQLASEVFERSFGLARRALPSDIGKITTNMVWHTRYDNDRKQAWLRDQIKLIYSQL